MARIIFLNRYFHPDQSATSQILSDLAFHLAATGHTVHVVSSRQLYDDPAAQPSARETVRGVQVHRIATTRFGRSNLPGRALDYLTFYVSVWRRIAALAGPGDIVVPMTDPPLLSVAAHHATGRRQAYLVNWLQDLYPEVAAELGVPLMRGPLGSVIAFFRNQSLRRAHANVVLGTSMAARARACGVAENAIEVIANWCNDEEVVPIPAADNPLRHEWGLTGKFVVGYSGNLGRAHEFDTVLDAADRLRGDTRIVFVCIGGGQHFDELKNKVRARKLEGRFQFRPYQDQAALRYSLSLPDVHWICCFRASSTALPPPGGRSLPSPIRPAKSPDWSSGIVAALRSRRVRPAKWRTQSRRCHDHRRIAPIWERAPGKCLRPNSPAAGRCSGGRICSHR